MRGNECSILCRLSSHFPDVQNLSVCVVLPAYHAEKTLETTLQRLPPGACRDIILVDDASTDNTIAVARGLGIRVHQHPHNRGYGGNQKTCYRLALETDAEIIVMLHPDNQYDGALVPYMTGFIKAGVVDIVLGSRISRREEVLAGGMPVIKYVANRILTIIENVVLGLNLPDTTLDIAPTIDACWKQSTSKPVRTTSCSISSFSCRRACTACAWAPCRFQRTMAPNRAAFHWAAARNTRSAHSRRWVGTCYTVPVGNPSRFSSRDLSRRCAFIQPPCKSPSVGLADPGW